jgi:hypothetical protein
MDKGTRGELLDRLAEAIESVSTAHPLRVAVDGPPDHHADIIVHNDQLQRPSWEVRPY